ncbi:UNVERIFIED_CONTAM: hypothetical protein Sradi_2706800 [Sesamum radiatum]|uniref:Uncharacterized protein n=1 Tax=Sesamum radiatum TaxID=300843 RepID=A0AAW2S6U5_SESRA
MDAAAQLVYCGIDPLHRTSRFSSAVLNTKSRNSRFFPRITKNAVVKAIATEPRPSDTKPPKVVNGSPKTASYKPINGASPRIQDVSQEIKRVRAQMEENEELAILMRGLRGQNLKDTLFADDNIKLRLVEVDESSEFLPLVYDPDSIATYWGKRPRAVATRIVQLMSVAGGFLSRLAWDLINNKIKEWKCLIDHYIEMLPLLRANPVWKSIWNWTATVLGTIFWLMYPQSDRDPVASLEHHGEHVDYILALYTNMKLPSKEEKLFSASIF